MLSVFGVFVNNMLAAKINPNTETIIEATIFLLFLYKRSIGYIMYTLRLTNNKIVSSFPHKDVSVLDRKGKKRPKAADNSDYSFFSSAASVSISKYS